MWRYGIPLVPAIRATEWIVLTDVQINFVETVKNGWNLIKSSEHANRIQA
jgi:hypothetical protein